MAPSIVAIGVDKDLSTKIDEESLQTPLLIAIINNFRYNIFCSNAEVYVKNFSLVCLVFLIRLSRLKQVCLRRIRFERYFSHRRAT